MSRNDEAEVEILGETISGGSCGERGGGGGEGRVDTFK